MDHCGRIRIDELADNSDDEKRLFRAEGRAKRKHKTNEEKKKKQLNRKQPFRRENKFPRSTQTVVGFLNQVPSRNIMQNPLLLHVAHNGTANAPLGPCFQYGKAGHLKRFFSLNNKT